MNMHYKISNAEEKTYSGSLAKTLTQRTAIKHVIDANNKTKE